VYQNYFVNKTRLVFETKSLIDWSSMLLCWKELERIHEGVHDSSDLKSSRKGSWKIKWIRWFCKPKKDIQSNPFIQKDVLSFQGKKWRNSWICNGYDLQGLENVLANNCFCWIEQKSVGWMCETKREMKGSKRSKSWKRRSENKNTMTDFDTWRIHSWWLTR
jgi:hypothetical protein